MKEVQMSGYVSEETRDLVDREVRMTGKKKGFIMEEALRFYLMAVRELPQDVLTHPKIRVTAASGEQVLERLENPNPTPALRSLLAGRDR